MDYFRPLFAVTVAGLSINTVAVGCRVWIRSMKKGAFGYDDGALCIAFVGSTLPLRVEKYGKLADVACILDQLHCLLRVHICIYPLLSPVLGRKYEHIRSCYVRSHIR